MTDSKIQAQDYVFCIYCGKAKQSCGCPDKLKPGDKPPERLHCPDCGSPRTECTCSPAWGSKLDQLSRGRELQAIRDDVESHALESTLAKEQARSEQACITLRLPESMLFGLRGLIGDTRIQHNDSLAAVAGELCDSFPPGYDANTTLPRLGKNHALRVRVNRIGFLKLAARAIEEGASSNELLVSHLESVLIALLNAHEKKAPAYPAS